MLHAASQYGHRQPHNHFRNIPYDCCGPVPKLRIPPSPARLNPFRQLHPSIPPLYLQRQSTESPLGKLEYYDVPWGLTKVHLKEKGLAAVCSKNPRRKRHLVRNVDNWLHLGLHSALWPLTLFFQQPKLSIHGSGIPFEPKNLNLKLIYCANA